MLNLSKTRYFWPWTLFFLSLGALFWQWSGSLFHLTNLWWNVDTYSHGLLVPAISLALVWSRRDWIKNVEIKTDWIGLLIVAVAACLMFLGAAAEVRILEHLALIVAVLGLIVMWFGRAMFHLFLFPFLFLFLAVPIGDSLIPVLQTVTAKSVLVGLKLFSVPYTADGVLITLSSGIYEVARACAGIKFFFTSLVTGVLLAHLAYRNWFGRIAILLVAGLLPLFANALRVLIILLIAESTDPEFAKGIDHIVYGWGFLSAILLVLIVVAYRFASPPEDRPFQIKTIGQNETAQMIAPGKVASFFVLTIAAIITAKTAAPIQIAWKAAVKAPAAPRCEDCDFRLIGTAVLSDKPIWAGAASEFNFRYRIAADTLTISGALYCGQRAGSRLVQDSNYPAGRGWALLPDDKNEIIAAGGWRLIKRTYWKGTKRRVVYSGYYINQTFEISDNKVRLETALARLLSGRSNGAVVTITVPHTAQTDTGTKVEHKFLSTFPPERFLWGGLKASDGRRYLCAV